MKYGYKFDLWLRYGGKVPRRQKKAFLGKRMSGSALRRLLKTVTIGPQVKTMFEAPNIHPFTFCPKCGEQKCSGTGNKTSYPEHWEYFYCVRCRFVVGCIDNSPLMHALQFKEFGYEIEW